MPQEFASIPYAGPAKARYGSYNKRYMVIHCTQNNASPANECAYARTRTDGVGLHFASDASIVLQGLESWFGTGHVGSSTGNSFGISWEFVGFKESPVSYWNPLIERAAASMIVVMAKWSIPARWLTDAQLRDGVSKGIVDHAQCSRVLGGSDHTDPGPNFPKQNLINALNGAAVTLTPNQEQQLNNIHDWLHDYFSGLITADSGTAHITIYKPNEIAAEIRAGVEELLEQAPITLTPDQINAIATALATNAAFAKAIADAVVSGLEMPTREERVQESFEGAQRAEHE